MVNLVIILLNVPIKRKEMNMMIKKIGYLENSRRRIITRRRVLIVKRTSYPWKMMILEIVLFGWH